MANRNMAQGARPHGECLRQTEYVASGIIYPGDFVILESGGRVAVATASAALCGVATTYASAAGQAVLVCDNPEQLFSVQASSTDPDAQTDINLNYDVVIGTASTTYRVSRQQLDSATGGTSSILPLKLLKIENQINDVLGANAKCVVKINNHQFAGGTGTTGV